MSLVHLSHRAGRELCRYLISQGHELDIVGDDPRFGRGVESHPDLRFCKAGASGPVLRLGGEVREGYPGSAAMCAVILGKFLIHRLDITDENILEYAKSRKLEAVNVRQGYTKCGCVTVDDGALITSDPGIIRALRGRGIEVLEVTPGHVALPGFPTGFIGGASGRVGGEVIFNGDLSAHPYFERICGFIRSRGLGVRYFKEYALEDIGSIIEEE